MQAHLEDVLAFAALLSLASGLHGTVEISPAQPVCMVGQSCSKPDANDVLAFWRGDRRIATTRTDGSGRYRRGLEPRQVVVPAGRNASVNFTLDIGIR